MAEGAESDTRFKGIDLSEDWCEYDDAADNSVPLSLLEFPHLSVVWESAAG